uniref:Uncharacterized protein n=1 Tax=Ciona savignyi TaxID=51511 RepID=H2ZNB1_CIOSA
MVLNKEDIELLKRNEPEWQPMPPNTPLTTRNIEQLRNHKLALTADQLKSVYLAEQLASILYTRGRLMFYKGFDQSRKEECIKFIKLAYYVAKEVARQTGIKLLHYLIAETNGLLYLKLALNNKSDDQKRKDYRDAYGRYEKLCVSTNKYFEHGIMKEDGKTSYHVMRCYKQMISANMKQLELPGEK